MGLPSLDRSEERASLRAMFARSDRGVGILYGRRRCGKCHLLLEAFPNRRAIYYLADDREGALQRSSLATEIARPLPGFDQIVHPHWDALLTRV